MSDPLTPAPGDYVVHYSSEGGVHRLVLARMQADTSFVSILTTFAALGGAQTRFEAEALARAARERVGAFRREEGGGYTRLG